MMKDKEQLQVIINWKQKWIYMENVGGETIDSQAFNIDFKGFWSFRKYSYTFMEVYIKFGIVSHAPKDLHKIIKEITK
ncbi:MAG: hypothetical protein JG770_1739 [Mahella sp.]|jgi:hypothetical protein|nr:hypothetical protein [Mahella sp.]MDI3508345.1 hypothetical protein [Clostridiales bacterium]MDK2902628.1 hypothetical protein [Clostridiales bacterium]MDK2991182.1 hypothetical protein [Clostridiales bacterium]